MSLQVGDMNLQDISGRTQPLPPTSSTREVAASVPNIDFAEFSVLSLCYSRSQLLRHLTREDTIGERP